MKRDSKLSAGKFALALTSAAGLATVGIPSAYAQSLSIVHNFTGGSDGGAPDDGFTMGPTGILFGTASTGGASGNGVVFEVLANGKVETLHNFAGGADGATPNGRVIRNADGVLFGTTTAGGASGLGTVFKLDGKKETVLYSFAGGSDGAAPQAALIMDASGNLYGTTSAGGPSGTGTVFELIAPKKKNGKWTEKVLYRFGAGTDGATPLSAVTMDAAGNLYGTTSVGGAYGYGTVFQLTPGSTWKETILYSFQNGDDGSIPYAGLISDAAGNLYGGTTQGGSGGGGTTFELSGGVGHWTLTTLVSQPGWGISGSFRDLLLDESGVIYGTTHCDGDNRAGTLFKLTRSGGHWTYKLLYTFTGGSDGQFTISNLVMRNGKLYGTTIGGGANGAGVVYSFKP